MKYFLAVSALILGLSFVPVKSEWFSHQQDGFKGSYFFISDDGTVRIIEIKEKESRVVFDVGYSEWTQHAFEKYVDFIEPTKKFVKNGGYVLPAHFRHVKSATTQYQLPQHFEISPITLVTK